MSELAEGLRILVVDDQLEIRQLVRRILRDDPVEVHETDGEGVLRMLSIQPFDVVLLDLFMPVHDGFEILRTLRREHPGMNIVAMSGGGFGGTMDLLSVAQLQGAKAIVRKPFDKTDLREAIARATA